MEGRVDHHISCRRSHSNDNGSELHYLFKVRLYLPLLGTWYLLTSQNENVFSWKDWAFNGFTHGIVIVGSIGVIWLFILAEEHLAGLPVSPYFDKNSAAEAYIGAGLLGGLLFWKFNEKWYDSVRRTTNDHGRLLLYCFTCKREVREDEDTKAHLEGEGHVVGAGWQDNPVN